MLLRSKLPSEFFDLNKSEQAKILFDKNSLKKYLINYNKSKSKGNKIKSDVSKWQTPKKLTLFEAKSQNLVPYEVYNGKTSWTVNTPKGERTFNAGLGNGEYPSEKRIKVYLKGVKAQFGGGVSLTDDLSFYINEGTVMVRRFDMKDALYRSDLSAKEKIIFVPIAYVDGTLYLSFSDTDKKGIQIPIGNKKHQNIKTKYIKMTKNKEEFDISEGTLKIKVQN